VLPVRVLGDDGLGWDVDTASGIVWAVDAGADVINLSLAIDVSSPQLEAAVDYAERAGVVVVAAAGNGGPSGKMPYPARYGTVVAVAASSPLSLIAGFSTWGPHVDVAAPGVGIVSTVPGGYMSLSGTSMAAPHVAGVAALVAASDPSYTPAQLRARLSYTATDAGLPGRDDAFGAGIIDPEALFGR
jgi:subtilisin family serine protease